VLAVAPLLGEHRPSRAQSSTTGALGVIAAGAFWFVPARRFNGLSRRAALT
jgi:hypothetical protein